MLLPYHNLKMKHQNPGATMPLVLPINVVCNTDDEVLFEQIRVNSRRANKWLNASPAHCGIAVMCGSGPSIKKDLGKIREMAKAGHTVFALNNCANFLALHGVYVDYQVILDARIETKALIGPAGAHLFASQVHPALFDAVPDAVLWQLDVGPQTEELFPDSYPEYALIGGAASVGNTALCVAYAMGYREMHCFGYDSSHDGDSSHAVHQKINDGDPCAYVDFDGKTYLCSLTMKLQAEKFQQTSADLKALGVELHVHGYGLLPDMFRNPDKVDEAAKYSEMWNHPKYRELSPGEELVPTFLSLVGERRGKLIDFGCGTGRAGAKLAAAGFEVYLVDFTENSRDAGVDLPFVQTDLTLPLHLKAECGYCTDVLEHLPTEQVQSAICNIMACVDKCFFQVSTVHDNLGAAVGRSLHLTVRPYSWWAQQFRQLGFRTLYSEESSISSIFYVMRESA